MNHEKEFETVSFFVMATNESFHKMHKIKGIDLAPQNFIAAKGVIERVDVIYLFKFEQAIFMK